MNTVYDPIPSERFNDVDPTLLCKTDWSKDSSPLEVDYQMFHGHYEIKVNKNMQVQKRNTEKRGKWKIKRRKKKGTEKKTVQNG